VFDVYTAVFNIFLTFCYSVLKGIERNCCMCRWYTIVQRYPKVSLTSGR